MSTPDILPDSRARETKGRIFTANGTWVPVYCANCGRNGGSCPEENMTFAFYLCNACVKTYGEVAGTMMVPDQVFYDKVRDEQMEAFGRPLAHHELLCTIEQDSSPLATLLKEAR
jgi:NAD-dependent SIR2 family protein deacetylase